MKTGIGERIKEVRGEDNQADFGAKFGVDLNTIGRYEREVSFPKIDFVSDLCRSYNLNPTWLIYGEGARLYREADIDDRDYKQLILGDFDLIPMVETRLSAGNGAFVVSENIEGYYAFKKTWVRRVATSAKSLVLLRVEGDSMQPTILTGDTVMIDTNRLDIIEGRIFAIRFDSTVMIKRLSFRPSNRIMVISDNKQEFDPYEVDRGELCILGQVIFFSRVLVHE